MVKEMTQIILTIENPDIIPSLRKVLGQINGVTISKTKKKNLKVESHVTINNLKKVMY